MSTQRIWDGVSRYIVAEVVWSGRGSVTSGDGYRYKGNLTDEAPGRGGWITVKDAQEIGAKADAALVKWKRLDGTLGHPPAGRKSARPAGSDRSCCVVCGTRMPGRDWRRGCVRCSTCRAR